MLKYLLFAACLLLALSSFATDASAPNAQGLRKLYGEPTIERFAVRSGITLTAQYGSDGVVCEFLIAPTQLLLDVQDPAPPPMSSEGVSDVLQEVIPEATRGKRTNSTTIQVGGNTLLKTDYENVSIRRICTSQSCADAIPPEQLQTFLKDHHPDITLSEPLWAACFLPRRLRSMILARSYSATMPCTWSRRSSSGLWPRGRFKNTTSTPRRRHSSSSKTW
jgi:hypothetical protein